MKSKKKISIFDDYTEEYTVDSTLSEVDIDELEIPSFSLDDD